MNQRLGRGLGGGLDKLLESPLEERLKALQAENLRLTEENADLKERLQGVRVLMRAISCRTS